MKINISKALKTMTPITLLKSESISAQRNAIETLEEERGVKETEASLTERSAALRTMKRVSATMSRSMATVPAKVQAMRSGLRRRS